MLLTSCAAERAAERVWVRPGATNADWKRDRWECTRDSRTAWAGGGEGAAGTAAIAEAEGGAQRQANDLFMMCMEAHGWRVEERGGAGAMMAEILTLPRRKAAPAADAGR